jgi:hypothetical protein
MALSSTSTLEDAVAQYRTNMTYDLQNSVAMCKAFIEACRFLLESRPNQVAQGTDSISIDPGAIQRQHDQAMAWWRANDTSSAPKARKSHVRYADFRGFRR